MRSMRTYLIVAAGFGLAGAASLALAQAGNEWPHYGGDYANTRYSALKQINTRT